MHMACRVFLPQLATVLSRHCTCETFGIFWIGVSASGYQFSSDCQPSREKRFVWYSESKVRISYGPHKGRTLTHIMTIGNSVGYVYLMSRGRVILKNMYRKPFPCYVYNCLTEHTHLSMKCWESWLTFFFLQLAVKITEDNIAACTTVTQTVVHPMVAKQWLLLTAISPTVKPKYFLCCYCWWWCSLETKLINRAPFTVDSSEKMSSSSNCQVCVALCRSDKIVLWKTKHWKDQKKIIKSAIWSFFLHSPSDLNRLC